MADDGTQIGASGKRYPVGDPRLNDPPDKPRRIVRQEDLESIEVDAADIDAVALTPAEHAELDHAGVPGVPPPDASYDVAHDSRYLASGEAAVPRTIAVGNTAAQSSGVLNLTHFTALKTEDITQVRMWTGGTAAAATPTLCRIGIFSVDADDNITLVASTANDTSLFAAANTQYTKALSSTFSKVAGQRYAVGPLIVSGAALPTFVGASSATSGGNTQLSLLAPRIASSENGLADLPASVTVGNLDASSRMYQVILLP